MYRIIQPCLSFSYTSFCIVEEVHQVLDVAPVWSAHPVGFALLTQTPHQYIAFYDAQRRMTVATRTLDAAHWHFVRLPETIGWDSHNYVTIAIDDEGYIHLNGFLMKRRLNP